MVALGEMDFRSNRQKEDPVAMRVVLLSVFLVLSVCLFSTAKLGSSSPFRPEK